MADLGEIQVRIAVATKQLKADLALAQAEFSKFGKKTEVEMNTMSAKVQATFARMGASLKAGAAAIGASISRSFHLAGMVIGTAFVYAGKKAVEFASDATESMNLFREVMTTNADVAMSWSKQLADDLDLNETQIRKWLSTFQLIIEAQDIGTDKSLELSKALVQLTVDLSSFRNMEFDEAFNKISSGIVGMPRPLRDVGINLQDLTVKEFALKEGMLETDREMNTREKTLARIALLLKRTEKDQGDFLRTQNDFANSTRQLSDAFRTAGEQFGSGLMKPLGDGFTKLKTYLKDNGEAFKTYGEVAGTAIRGIITVFEQIAGSIARRTDELGSAIEKLEQRIRNANVKKEILNEQVKRGWERMTTLDPNAELAVGLQGPGPDTRKRFTPRGIEYGPRVEVSVDTSAELNEQIDDNSAAAKRLAGAYKNASEEAGNLKTKEQELKPALSETGKLFQQFADSVGTKFQQMSNLISNSLDSVSDTLTDLAMTGKADFKSLAESIARDITQMIIKLNMLKIAMAIFPGLAPAEIVPVPTTATSPAGIQHSGGTVGQGARQMNLPSMVGVPRFHNGLARDEKLTVLQDGEEVTPKGSSPKAIVNVNSPDVPINAEVTGIKQSMGNMIIDVLVSAKRRRDPRLVGF